MLKSLFVAALLCVFSVSQLVAQTTDPRYPKDKTPFAFGVVETLQSKALEEERVLNIYLPQGYDPDSAATYPVLYVLDGSAHEDFPHIAGLVQFMNMYAIMPHTIVVGIQNVDRYRDFTYPSTDKRDCESIPQCGGSERFINFIEQEVQPFIEANYKSNGHKTIVGQSLGGLVATEILIKKPHLFDDYVIVSPSLWWDKQILVDQAPVYFKEHQELQKRVFVSLGKEHPEMHEVADELVAAIRESGNKNMQVWYEPILDEDHATILHSACYKAFKALNKKAEKEH